LEKSEIKTHMLKSVWKNINKEEKVSCIKELRVIVDYYELIVTIVALTDSHEDSTATISKLCKGTRIRVTTDFAKFKRTGKAMNSYSD